MGSKNTVSLQKLFLTQKKAIRIIANSAWRVHTYPLFHKFSILKIEELYKLQVACLCLKFIMVLCLHILLMFFHENAYVAYTITILWTCT